LKTKTMTDTTFTVQSDSSIVVYFVLPSVRYAGTAVIRFNNDWQRFEPQGANKVEPLRSYVAQKNKPETYPLNNVFNGCQYVCTFVATAFFATSLAVKLLR